MINFHKELEKITKKLEENAEQRRLLLHSCCAPCSSHVLDYLHKWFDITVFFYNPNIHPFQEYVKRKNEQIKLIKKMESEGIKINFLDMDYETEKFFDASCGLEKEREGGERCYKCYEFRLRKTSEFARDKGYDFFSTTLTVSPYKNAQKINEIGMFLESETGAKYLCSDFKKGNGYLRSIELSKKYELYRQNYCGCIFSKNNNF